jgi:hypothetical protein
MFCPTKGNVFRTKGENTGSRRLPIIETETNIIIAGLNMFLFLENM